MNQIIQFPFPAVETATILPANSWVDLVSFFRYTEFFGGTIFIANYAVLPPEPENSLGSAVLKFEVDTPGLALPGT